MPTDSNGNHSLPPGYLAVTGQTVFASQHNAPLEDLSDAMTGRLPRNGSAPMNANLRMAGYKVTGLAAGTAAADAFTKGQFDAVAVTLTGTQTLTNKTLTSPTINTPTIASPVVTDADPWAFQPISKKVDIEDHIPGVPIPPKDKGYRYVLLTAGESGAGKYNEGILTGESVSGSFPLVVATAVVNLVGSPYHGRTINLINTERRFLRAGASGTVENDALQNIKGTAQIRASRGGNTQNGVFSNSSTYGSEGGTFGSSTQLQLDFDASLVARTSNETRVKNIGVSYYMRIK